MQLQTTEDNHIKVCWLAQYCWSERSDSKSAITLLVPFRIRKVTMTCNDFKSKGNWFKKKKKITALSIQYLCSKAALSMCFRTWYLMHCDHCSKQWVGAYMGTHHISGHLWQMFFTCLRTFYNSALTVWLWGTNSWCMALSVMKKQLTCLWSHFMIWWAAFRLWYCGIFHCKFPFRFCCSYI